MKKLIYDNFDYKKINSKIKGIFSKKNKFNMNFISNKKFINSITDHPFIFLVIFFIIVYAINYIFRKQKRKKIYVGCLYSTTGIMGEFEKPNYEILIESFKYVLIREEIDIDYEIVPLFKDLKSEDDNYIKWIEDCIKSHNVKYFFGCWKSSTRKHVLSTLKKYNIRLFYPLQYEGVESLKYVYYFGSTPNQQILPALDYYFSKYNKKDVYIIGSDYVYPRVSSELIKNYMKINKDKIDKEIKNISYHPLDEKDFSKIIDKILTESPDGAIIINNINGDSLYKFFEQFYNKYYKQNTVKYRDEYNDALKFIDDYKKWNNNGNDDSNGIYSNMFNSSYMLENFDNKESDEEFDLNFKIYTKYPVISFSLPENNISSKYNKYLYSSSSCWSFMTGILDNPSLYIINIGDKKVLSDIEFLQGFKNGIIGDTQYSTFLSVLFFITTIKEINNNNGDYNKVEDYDKYKLTNVLTVTGTHVLLKNNHINKPFYCGYFDNNNKYIIEYDSIRSVDPDPFYGLSEKDRYTIFSEIDSIYIKNK